MANLNNTTINGNLTLTSASQSPDGVDYIVERGGNNSLWWTIWSSGWKECGGIIPPQTPAIVTQTFPITFSSLPSLTATFLYGYDGGGLYEYLCPRNITTSSFQIRAYQSYCQGTAWRAEGF